MSVLYDNESVKMLRANWQVDAYEAFVNKMLHKQEKFPCVPAIQGLLANELRFGFIEHASLETMGTQFAQLLTEYNAIARETGNYAALIVFCGPGKENSIEAYEETFWRLLEETTSLDEVPWPEAIPHDPHHHAWEFCFGQEPYFVYCATPLHEMRQSRYFPYLMFALTPRWVLTQFNENKKRAEKMSKHIRERLVAYDHAPIHPDLNQYGNSDNHEWKQYFLRDDEQRLSKCPFHHLWTEQKQS
ncbi:hypothetical protein A374_11970 [Fictibacillus macauensis ZFHKF-1]|uniref:YqcI/YcgG family protein n=1 Tax=Fictibacillus macauensis ZFHKF-1 TaxID=1196324 RepID=I8AHV8_9BACL|nr:YqcI/YcgG family protein [Fictibacillus macauensis]EIT85014.1 hypothetical protein A374_11970 [Fictibacillus macauensis ZFHKF-1]